MLYTEQAFAELVDSLETKAFAFDFETDGLDTFTAQAFIMGFAFNDVVGAVFLTPRLEGALAKLFAREDITFVAHNFSFEMGILKHQFGISIKGKTWDTEVMAVVEHNGHFKNQGGAGYGLQACASRIGLSKYPPMLEWLAKHGPKYHEAPDELIIPYVEQDAFLSLALYRDQVKTFQTWDRTTQVPIKPLVMLEMETTKAVFEMEQTGILLNLEYCHEAIKAEKQLAKEAHAEFARLTGRPFVSSAKCLKPIFDTHKIPYGRTEKGAPSFNYDALEPSKDHPIVATIFKMRDSDKRVSTYWENFIKLNHNGRLHPSIRQAGTTTGRFSCAEPNLQNLPDDFENPCEYPIRRAFIARNGCKIVSIDYSQMEYRMMADEAQDQEVIAEINNKVDPHQKVANLAGVARGLAKNCRFARQYGAGEDKLAMMLKQPRETVRKILQALDDAAPRCAEYSRELTAWAKRTGWGWNAFGRRYFFKDGFYKYPNYRIQGRGADVLREAIVKISKYIKEHRLDTRMVIVIHDEIVFDMPVHELHHAVKFKELMIAANPHKTLPLDCAISIGDNMHDLDDYVA